MVNVPFDRKHCVLTAAAAVATLAALGAGARTAAAAICPNAGAPPAQSSLAQLRAAVACLVERARDRAGEPPLRRNLDLTHAARRHTRTMVAGSCIENRCPGEGPLRHRIRITGYPHARDFPHGEDIGYDRTPRKIVYQWLGFRFSRHRMLNGCFRDFGVGARRGSPIPGVDDSRFATYTLVVAARSEPAAGCRSGRHHH